MNATPSRSWWLRAMVPGVFALLGGCVLEPAPGPRHSTPSGASRSRVPAAAIPLAAPPIVVESAPAQPVNRVVFFSEPNFRGESFVVETGAAVENLARLARGRGSWNDAISSFRIEGVATIVAYTDADFRGPHLETSSSLSDLVAERRGAPETNWDRVISSLRVVPPRSRSFEPEPGYDRRTADNIVQRAYRDLLGRDADAGGLQSYRKKLMEGGWSEEEVRNEIRRSGEFRAINPDDVITRAYHEVLKREPDPEGLRHYRELLTNHGWTIPQLRADLLRSDEWSDQRIHEVITKAYREILGRDPDPGGYETYVRAIRDKAWGEPQIRDSLLRSAEYRQKHGK